MIIDRDPSACPRTSYRSAHSYEIKLITEIAMTAADLAPAFDIATALWTAQEADPEGPDVMAGGLLDAASELQIAVGRMLAFAPASSEAEIAVKERIADQLDATRMLDEHDIPVGAALRLSIEADRLRLRLH